MKTRLLLTFFLTVALSGSGLASDPKHIELQYNSENSPLQILLKEGSTLSILSDGNVSATADDSFACDIDCPECTPCDDVRVDMLSFTVNNGSTATVTQNKSVVFKWNSRGAYACDGSGLPNTTWNSNNKYPVNTSGVSVNVGELEPGDYAVAILCHNGPIFQTAAVTVTVEEEVGVPEGCEGVSPAHMTRASYCVYNEPGRDCYDYEQVFGAPFPGNTITRTYFNDRDYYGSMQFTTSSTLKPGATGKWSVSEPSGTPLPTGGNKIWSISDCPGDFDEERISTHPDLGPGCYTRPRMATSSITWGGEDYLGDTLRCGLKPGKTYYFNLIYTDSPGGTDPDLLEWGCGEGREACANKIAPVFNEG